MGIMFPDEAVRRLLGKRKDLYLPGHGRSPSGEVYKGNWRQLYFVEKKVQRGIPRVRRIGLR